jgi:hypothetical protein
MANATARARKAASITPREAWRDTRWIQDAAGHSATVWTYKPGPGEHISAETHFSGIAPGSVALFAEAIERHGHAILDCALDRPQAPGARARPGCAAMSGAPTWLDYGPAEFDRRRLPNGASLPDPDQAGLFFMAREATPPKPARVRPELPGQGDLLGDES